jgi:hypothetical protein
MPITIFFFRVGRSGFTIIASVMVVIIPFQLSIPIFFPITKPTIIANFPTFKQMFELRRFEGYFEIPLEILAHSMVSQSLEFLVFLIAAICVLLVTSAHCSKPPIRAFRTQPS